MSFVDLLYPGAEFRDCRLTDFSFVDELDLYGILEISDKTFDDLTDYFTKSREVIEYRNDVLRDFADNDCMSDIDEIIRIIDSIKETRESRKQASEIISVLYTIFEIEIYIKLIDFLNGFFGKHSFKSAALTGLNAYVREVSSDESYNNLKENLKNFRYTIDNIASITVGVNLGNQMKPNEAGVISVNTSKFRSGNLFDRIMSLDMKDDGFRCLAPLTPVKADIPGHQALLMSFNNALEVIIRRNLREWQPIVRKYIADNTNGFINMANDLRFYRALNRYAEKCKQKGLGIVKPEIVPDNMSCKDIYYLPVALHTDELIYNDIEFDSRGRIYILTGPNHGGKSVMLKAIGVNQALFQLGGYVNASEARLKISSNILIYLTKNNERSLGFGHLGIECEAVSKLLAHAGEDCLFLFDEAFSSTSASEQCVIACEVLTALSELRCYGIFITHNHDIYDRIKETALRGAASPFDSLSAQMSEEGGAERSYKIVRKVPEKNSFAMDIARKHKLLREDIIKGKG
jgi:DNA mismatch repair ATPase MutS